MLSLRGKEFNNEILKVSLTCYKDTNNKPWFVGSQVAKVLGYKDTNAAIRRHVENYEKITVQEFKGAEPAPTPLEKEKNVQPHAKLINESGLYSLVFGSELAFAKKFKKWVFEDVLPSIREQGYYALPGALDAIIAINSEEVKQLEGTNRKKFRKESKYKSNLSKDLEASQRAKDAWITRRNNELLKKYFQKWRIAVLKSQVEKLNLKLSTIKLFVNM